MENQEELNTKWKPNGTYDSKLDQKGSKTKKGKKKYIPGKQKKNIPCTPAFIQSLEKKSLKELNDKQMFKQMGSIKARANSLEDRFK